MTTEQPITPDFDESTLPVRQDTGDLVPSEKLLEAFGVDVEQQVRTLKKVAEHAPEIIKYRSVIIKQFTYPQDWVKFGSGEKAKACCSNHAVMRIVDKANFPIRYAGVHSTKEDIFDADNVKIGYRYIFEGYGEMNDRNVFCIGQYSTRDAFLGKVGGEYRDWREINESYIRQSAHTFFKGNVVKDLLGLKNIPWEEFENLCEFAGQVAEKSASVEYHQGGKGGTSDVDRTSQNSLYDMLHDLATNNLVVKWEETEDGVKHFLGEPSDEQLDFIAEKENPIQLLAKASLKALTTWKPKDGSVKAGISDFKRLKGKQPSFLTKTKVPELIKEHANASKG
jgi:hypothetical protein